MEADLAAGSNAASGAGLATGTFTLSDADGLDDLQSVTVNGTTVALASLVGSVFAGTNGTLTITAYDSATGVASYSYEQTSPTTDGPGIETDSFSLTASDGSATSAPASIVIEIVDDVPNAVNDSSSVAEDALATLSGEVLSNDLHANGQPGADTPISFVAWGSTAASFVSFTDTGSGTYSYSLNNANPAVQALDSGESLTETFSYTMQDADGDTDTATLTITITGSNDGPQITVDSGNPGSEGGNDQVFEAGLAAGSNAASDSEFATGTFSLSDADGPDDLQSVTINGTTVALGSLVGSVFTGTHGSLTITAYDSLTGVASYSYELTTPTTDGPGLETDSFSLTVSDGTASSAPASLVIEILDDVPNAADEGISIVQGALSVLIGNVLSNDLHANGQAGADSPTSFVAWSSTAANFGSFSDTGGGSGSYSLDNLNLLVQALDSGETLSESFSYTMQDADGDTASASLTLTITGSNDGPQLSVDPGNEGGNDQVSEAGLASGSAAASNSEFATGSFSLSDADGLDDLQSVTINGTTVLLSSLVGRSFAGTNGTLTIDAYDGLTGLVSYTYELTNPTIDGADSESDVFSLTVSDGTTTSAPASIVIEIIDDLPSAVDDSNGITEDTVAAITGNVLSNDLHINGQPGADIATSFVSWNSIAGNFGTFSDTGNGTYSYVLNNANPAVQALDNGETLTETFTYNMQDADGDPGIATLTITITGSNDGPGVSVDPGSEAGNDQVFEAGLPTGSNAASNSEFATGTFRLSDADGLDDLQSVTINNGSPVLLVNLAGSVFTGSHGKLTVTAYDSLNGVASYTYELTSRTTDGPGIESDVFSLTVSDGTTTSAPASIVIEIIDDMPSAVDDSNAAFASEINPTLSGNVLSNDVQGADRVAGGPIQPAVLQGIYGTLTLNADGSYNYQLDPNDPDFLALGGGGSATETFGYTHTDADTDSDTADLVLQIRNKDDDIQIKDLDVPGGEHSVDEDDLADGSDPDKEPTTVSGSFKVEAQDGILNLSVHGLSVVAGGVVNDFPQSVTTPLGKLTITGYEADEGIVSYSYTLLNNGQHAPGAGENLLAEHFEVVAEDVDHDVDTAFLDINIVDDVPTAHADSNSVTEGGVLSGNVLTDGLDDVFGADGPTAGGGVVGVKVGNDTVTPASGSVGIALEGSFGTLTLHANGTYTYGGTPNVAPPAGATDVFTYTVQDGDGDLSTTTLTINLSDSGLTAPADNDALVYEKALDTNALPDGADLAVGSVTGSLPGSSGETDASNQLNASGGFGTLSYAVVGTGVGSFGTIQISSNGSYVYTLTAPVTSNPAADDGANTEDNRDSFSYTVTDANGNTRTGSITVDIVDDVPTAHADSNSVGEGALLTVDVAGGVLSNDEDGADGFAAGGGVVGVRAAGGDTTTAVTSGVGGSIVGLYGTLTLAADGSYSYQSNANTISGNIADVFVYTVQDGDGDLSTTTLTINLSDSGLTAPDDNDALVYEKALDTNALPDGADLAVGSVTGSLPGSSGETDASNQLNAAGGFGALSYAVVGTGVGSFGTIQISSNGSYVYTLTAPVTSNPAADDGANTEDNRDSFSYTVTDANGNTRTGSITVDIVDDVPTAMADTDSVIEDLDTTATGNVVVANDNYGADGGVVVGVKAGTDVGNPVTTGVGIVINGLYGTLVLNALGSYTYTLNNSSLAVQQLNVDSNVSDEFTYTIRDADGDQATTTLIIDVNGINDPIQGEFAKEVWMPADVAQMTNPYEQGYPLQIKVPTDIDGTLSLTITELPLSGQIGYYDATNAFVPISLGVLDVNLVDDLIYIPGVGAAPGDFLFKFTVGSSDGESVNGNFVIHTVPANSEPAQEVVIGDGKTPLTSGNDQNKNILLTQEFANGLINNLATATLVLFTDYQKAPFAIPIPANERDIGGEVGNHRETEVSVSITVDGIEFSVLEADPAGSIDQDWFFDPATGLMRAEVGFTQTMQVGNPSVSLDDYLLANPPAAGDTWTLTYFDNDGGNFQARYVKGEFFYNSPGDPGIMVVGDPSVPNLIFGTTSGDSLTGGNVDDVINGREGNDQLYGLGGNDQVAGGSGLDLLVGGHGDDLLTGGDGKDTLVWNSGDAGVDHITDFFIDGPDVAGGNSDVLELSQLLVGETASGNVLDDYLSFTFAATSTTINVRATPSGAVVQQVVLDDVDLSSVAYYGPTDAATMIDGMLNDNALKVDNV
ncbi:VCBS domain-containing protein [Pseudomonas cavernicola]|uniref:VCBS domain-containing protein n=1 Tax=Pseudomonas cavernicola TaxID=2320866 RepID=UPI001EE5ABDB|nr:VCBS domain-containing protein [Pseudomonas cavernicola]